MIFNQNFINTLLVIEFFITIGNIPLITLNLRHVICACAVLQKQPKLNLVIAVDNYMYSKSLSKAKIIKCYPST